VASLVTSASFPFVGTERVLSLHRYYFLIKKDREPIRSRRKKGLFVARAGDALLAGSGLLLLYIKFETGQSEDYFLRIEKCNLQTGQNMEGIELAALLLQQQHC